MEARKVLAEILKAIEVSRIRLGNKSELGVKRMIKSFLFIFQHITIDVRGSSMLDLSQHNIK